jgi:hypothetical protein
MAISIKHKKNSTKPDSSDTSLILPSDWNDTHDIEMAPVTLLGNPTGSAGDASEIPLGAGLSFSDGALEAEVTFDSTVSYNAQTKTAAEQGNARANIGVGILAGFRNKIINGDFSIWQRATSQTATSYGSDDRWQNINSGSTKTHSRQAFALGQTAVPGEPEFFSRTVSTSVPGTSHYVSKVQAIESVRTLAGKTATLTFWAKADAARNIAIEFLQNFGSGGSPSTPVTGIGAQVIALTTAWQKFTRTISIPSIAGKTLGTNRNDCLQLGFWFDAGSDYNSRTGGLGQQSGTFDIAHVSLVEGDATAEEDPFSPRHIQQEMALCQRYYQVRDGVFRQYTSNVFRTSLPLPVIMRASPTLTKSYSSSSGVQTDSASATASDINLDYQFTSAGNGTIDLVFTFRLDAEL